MRLARPGHGRTPAADPGSHIRALRGLPPEPGRDRHCDLASGEVAESFADPGPAALERLSMASVCGQAHSFREHDESRATLPQARAQS